MLAINHPKQAKLSEPKKKSYIALIYRNKTMTKKLMYIPNDHT